MLGHYTTPPAAVSVLRQLFACQLIMIRLHHTP